MKTNRRQFISILGLISIGSLSKNQSKALEIDINRFNNNTQVNLTNVETITIKIKDITLTSNNINYNKEAKLDVYGRIDGNNIGEIKTYNINIKKDETYIDKQFSNSELLVNLKNGNDFDKSYLSNETYTDQSTINIDIIFKLNHPSLNKTISETANYTLGLGSNNDGELIKHDFKTYNNKTSSSLEDTIVFSGSNLQVLDQSKFNQVEQLVSGGATINNTSTTFTSGGIDIDNISFNNSSPRNYRDLSVQNESNATNFNGNDLNVLDLSGFNQVKQLVSGGATYNNTSTTFESGGIDINDIPFKNSSPKQGYNIQYSEPDSSVYKISNN